MSDEDAVSLVCYFVVIIIVIIDIIFNNHSSNTVRLPMSLAVGKIITWYYMEKN